ncbi:MAG: DUF885 domain-containing protein [Steroidobacteraceae bacterium]
MIRFLHAAPPGFAVLILAACGAAAPPPPFHPASSLSPRDQLTRLVEHYWDEYLLLNPQKMPEGAATRYDGACGYDISPQFLADSLALERRYLAAVLAVPRLSLDVDSRLTYDIFRRERELAIEGFTYPSELFPVNPFSSMPLKFAQAGTGAGQYAILSEKDYEHWQARTDAYVRWTDQAIVNMRDGIRRGYALPRVLVEEMLPLLAALGADTPVNVFYQPLRSIPATVADAQRNRLSVAISAAVRDKILPSYRSLHDFLRDEYLPRARAGTGLSELPLGVAWYAFLIKRETGTALAPADIQTLGAAEVERLHGRVRTLLAATAFAGNVQGFYETMRRDPHLFYSTPDELLSYYDDLKVKVAAALPALFSQETQADFAIRRVEPFREGTAPALSYQRATPNGKTPAVLYVNAAGIAAQPITAEAAGFLREADPGHHYQLTIQQERSDLPRFRRFGGDPAFVEGWGLYAASLGEELGLYRDTESKFAALLGQLECAAAMVIDTGLHAQGWTRQEAIDYLHAQLPIDEAAVRERVDRDIALPGQALACTMGERGFSSLRARAEQTLGARFDIRAFHAELLKDGAMPLNILESKVKRWLDGLH